MFPKDYCTFLWDFHNHLAILICPKSKTNAGDRQAFHSPLSLTQGAACDACSDWRLHNVSRLHIK